MAIRFPGVRSAYFQGGRANLRGKNAAVFALCVTALVIPASPAQSQQVDVPGFRPGRESELLKTPLLPKSAPDISVPEGGGAAATSGAEEIAVDLLEVTIEGSTVYQKAELAPLYQPLLDKRSVTLADFYRLAEALTVKYRDDGYVLTKAIVPAQHIKGGAVRIQVIEGFIDKVTIQSDKVAEDDPIRLTLMPYLILLTNERPARMQTIERILLLINDLAGMNGRAVIRPSAGAVVPGAAELVLVLDTKLVSASLTIDNYGSKYTGPISKSSEVSFNSPLGFGERLTLRGMTDSMTQKIAYGQIDASVPMGNDGLTFHMSYSQSSARPGFLLSPLKVHSRSWVKEASIGYPVIRSRAGNLTWQLGMRSRNTLTDVLDNRFTVDRNRSAFFNTVYDFVDPWGGANMVGVTFTQGLDWFDATGVANSLSSRPGARAAFRKVGGELTRVQQITDGFSAVLGTEWQMGFGSLPSTEEFAVGGKGIGRGYDSGEILGDQGVSAKVELHYRDRPEYEWLPAYDFYTFYDVGMIWNLDDVDNGTANELKSLASAGIGVQVPIQEWFSAKFEIAKPLTRTPAVAVGKADDERKYPHLFGSLTIKY